MFKFNPYERYMMPAHFGALHQDENSSGLRVLMAIMMITKLMTILKVNKKSNKSGGNGKTNMAMINNTMAGMPNPV